MYKYPENEFSNVSIAKLQMFKNQISFDAPIQKNKMNFLCGSSRRRKPKSPPPNPAPIKDVLGVNGLYTDSDGVDKPGLLFICKATQINRLLYDSTTPIYGKIYYGKYRQVNYRTSKTSEWIMIPTNIVLRVGDEDNFCPENSPFISGEENFDTEFWVFANDRNQDDKLILNDNDGTFEFILFFYSEKNSRLLAQDLQDLLEN